MQRIGCLDQKSGQKSPIYPQMLSLMAPWKVGGGGLRFYSDTSDLVTSLIPFPPSTSLPPPRIEPSHGELCRCGDDAVLPEGYRIVPLVAQRRILGANWAMVPWNTGQEARIQLNGFYVSCLIYRTEFLYRLLCAI